MNRAMQALVAIMSAVMLARGVDYLTGNSFDMGRIWGDQLGMPELWGTACVIVVILAFGGLLTKKSKLVINGALMGAAVYIMFAVQVADTRMFAWPPEDIRLIADHIGHAAMWGLVVAVVVYREGVDKRKAAIIRGVDG